MSDIDDIIMGGMVFKGGGGSKKDNDDKVKTKAKKKKYITGAHGSGSFLLAKGLSYENPFTLHLFD